MAKYPKSAKTGIKKILKKEKKTSKELYGIKQGVGRITRYAFPKKNRKKPDKAVSQVRHGLNALHPTHLPLPRAVGGYTVVRTTDVINTNTKSIFFGTFKGPGAEFTDTTWLSTVAVTYGGSGFSLPIRDEADGGNSYFYESAALKVSALNGARMTPAAITVQIMGGDPLQSAAGIAYIGRSKTVLDLMGDSRTWETLTKELVSYSSPRLCSAGKLSLRGVQVNGVPNNMSVLSDFVPRRIPTEGRHIWKESTFAADFEGFGPIFVYNPDAISLKYLVTIEWRMRFDPLNPAYASHIVHRPASESTWSTVIGDAESLGNGVMDIADVVADTGVAAAGASLLF